MLMLFIAIIAMLIASPCYAATYWISPTGTAATLAACSGSTPLSGTAACAWSEASGTGIAAGDTVYYRDGNYTVNADQYVIAATDIGTTESVVTTYSAYGNEVPNFQFTKSGNYARGISLAGKSYVKVHGLKFSNCQGYGVIMSASSNHNEISSCQFINSGAQLPSDRAVLISGGTSPCTHNWIHHCYFSGRQNRNGPCNEGVDIFRVGDDGTDHASDNFTTVENNYLEYGAHSIMLIGTKHNVVRNNIGHNEPWIAGCTVYDGTMNDLYGNKMGTTSASPVTFEVATGVNFTVDAGLPTLTDGTCKVTTTSCWETDQPITILKADDFSKAMWGTITTYNSTTGALVARVYRVSDGASGSASNWIISRRNVPYYTVSAYNGLYSHRGFDMESDDMTTPAYNLVESNRFGFGGINPNNDGAGNMSIGLPNNIVRYNSSYSAMSSGMGFSWANGTLKKGGVRNRIYNNTVYSNYGGWNSLIYGGMNMGYGNEGIQQYSATGNDPANPTENVIKNNLVYSNSGGDICYVSQTTNHPCNPSTIDTVDNNWCTASGSGPCSTANYGDPNFVNADLSDPLSQNLLSAVHGYIATPIPNLSLRSSSGAIDKATYLTLAGGAGADNATLHVDDALYFQDGTLGSDLTRTAGTMLADWIAIGTVTNTVQISSIDYATNTITLAEAKSWADDAPIWLYKKSDGSIVLYGSAPDYGAYEYNPSTAPKQSLSGGSLCGGAMR